LHHHAGDLRPFASHEVADFRDAIDTTPGFAGSTVPIGAGSCRVTLDKPKSVTH
jgi:hypothetical protein